MRSNASWVMVTWGPREQTDRHEKKHDLPTTSLAGGKNKKSHKPAIQAEIQHDRLPAIIARITIFVISPVIWLKIVQFSSLNDLLLFPKIVIKYLQIRNVSCWKSLE